MSRVWEKARQRSPAPVQADQVGDMSGDRQASSVTASRSRGMGVKVLCRSSREWRGAKNRGPTGTRVVWSGY